MLRTFVSALATTALLLTASAASADSITVYDLSGVTLSAADSHSGNGGTLTGSFTVDYTTNTISAWSITASAETNDFAAFTYNSTNSSAIDGLASMYFQSDDPTNDFELRLYFPQGTALPLPSGTSILTTNGVSYDSQPTITSTGNHQFRYVTGGSVVIDSGSAQPNGVISTPLPAAASMTLPLLAGLGLWKSRKKTVGASV